MVRRLTVSERLDKAIAALEDAGQGVDRDSEIHLLAIATTQALIATAEALEELVSWLPNGLPVQNVD